MLRKTPAREAGTWCMPQFHSRVVVAVQAIPLMASATHAVVLTCAKGMGCALLGSHGLSNSGPNIHMASMTVPMRMVYAVTTGGLCVCISFLLSRIHERAV